jgi:hypothetical protein
MDDIPFLRRSLSASQQKKIARQLDIVRDVVDECVQVDVMATLLAASGRNTPTGQPRSNSCP